MPFRIIERKLEREGLSKALAIHPRTLELLERSEVTPRLIESGYKMQQMHIYEGEKERLTLDFRNLRHRYNYVVLLPQSETERILEERLAELGVEVERGVEMAELTEDGDGVVVQLPNGSERFDQVIGADGAHSWTRKSLGVAFEGRAYPNEWNFIDVAMSWSGQTHELFMKIHPHGLISMIFPIRPGLYRIAATGPDARVGIPAGADLHEIVWESTFRIQVRQVASYQKGRIFLAGDAAHIHSPAGGRGMNLGIEDATILAQLVAGGQTDRYTAMRRTAGRRVIEMTEALVRIQTVQSRLLRLLRNWLLYPLLGRKWVQRRLLPRMTGLK